MKAKNFLLAITLLLLVERGQANSLAFEMDSLSELETLTKKCISSSLIQDCQHALSLAEVLQRQASSQGNYACQSRLLGLGADLLMVAFDAGRDKFVLPLFKEVQILCKGL